MNVSYVTVTVDGSLSSIIIMSSLVDPGGGVLGTHAPSQSNFFHFHADFGNILPNNRFLAQTQGLVPPSLGKSWIYDWSLSF